MKWVIYTQVTVNLLIHLLQLRMSLKLEFECLIHFPETIIIINLAVDLCTSCMKGIWEL
jgi:hypothetical protein